jgi:glycosyltransferase involved in cell wall biosynthesis
MVSRMDDAKDQDTLLHAVAKLIRQGRELHLCLAGDGPRKVFLEQLTEQLGIEKQVHFAGVCKDVPQLLGASDLFVFATKTEGFGLVLIESMSAGTPVISSDIPVCRDILDQGACGMLYQSGNVDSLADSILYMLDHPDEAKQYAERARKRAMSDYSFERTVEQYCRLLHGELDVLPSNLSATSSLP